MSSEEPYIECDQHGRQQATFVCQHIVLSLRDGKPRGFISSEENEENPRPDSWCNKCDDKLTKVGEWNDESEAFANVTLICGECYDQALKMNIGFGETLFSGSRFIFWVLAPVFLLFAISVPLMTGEWNIKSAGIILPLIIGCILMILILYDPIRFHWAARCVTALVFLLYSFYLYDSLFQKENSSSSLIEPILGFFIIGLPCLSYTIKGKFSFFSGHSGN